MAETYRVHKVHVEAIAQLLDARRDLVEVDLLLASICIQKRRNVVEFLFTRNFAMMRAASWNSNLGLTSLDNEHLTTFADHSYV
jgi:ABC-type phosphonate transport system ATPase subunit